MDVWYQSEACVGFGILGPIFTHGYANQLIENAIVMLSSSSQARGESKLKVCYSMLAKAMNSKSGMHLTFEEFEYAQVRLVALFWAKSSVRDIVNSSFAKH